MTKSDNIGQLAAALAKAQGSMKPALKDSANPYFKSSYADLPAVWEAARSALADNDLSVIQTTDFDGEAGFVITTLAHKSGEWISGRYRIKPVKEDPQSWGSAVTYARRYAFAAIVGVTAADEDDDGNKASGNGQKAEAPKPETAKARNDRFASIKKELSEAEDPAEAWGKWVKEINEFKKQDQQYYDDLLNVAKTRKEQLAKTVDGMLGDEIKY